MLLYNHPRMPKYRSVPLLSTTALKAELNVMKVLVEKVSSVPQYFSHSG
jgi:hypothetical protein